MIVPRIGITTFREDLQWDGWNLTWDLVPARYGDAVRDAGGVPLLLPPATAELAGPALDGVHGLLIAGGNDVDPNRYGARRHAMTGGLRIDRDEWELALVREALTRDLPLLAVCRGMQILNVALGGTLFQHLPDVVGSERHAPVRKGFGRHEVCLVAGSRLAAVLGERTEMATSHHQAIDRLGDGLVVCGSAEDGVVEAVELPTQTWTFGVQWHPEVFDGKALFTSFVEACAGRRVPHQIAAAEPELDGASC